MLAGVALGVTFALLLERALRSLLYGVQCNDPLIVAGVVLVLAVTGAVAIWIPARRAAKTDPAITLRNE